MIPEKNLLLLAHLRENARKSLASISKATNIPATTLFDKLKEIESLVIKHTTLVDFNQLGYGIRKNIILKGKDKDKLKQFLINHANTNSVYEINTGYDFMIECVFKDYGSYHKFLNELDELSIEKRVFDIISDNKREGFLSY